ncbi:hypothetical protein [Poriferisphaera corsica]|nr:hypothetical protein [Poriferisphaera corsica]
MMNITLAYRLFLDPLPIENSWMVFLLPLVFAVALVYKTIRLPDLSKLWTATLLLATQIVVFMVITAAVLWVITAIF